MNSKILILACVALYQVSAQQPTVFPNLGGLGGTGLPPFLGSFNTNWARPYYTAAAEGWRTYFEQLQQARNQLFQTLSSLQTTANNASGTARETVNHILSALSVHSKHAHDDDETQILGDLHPPAVDVPAHQETQIVTTVTRPTLPQVQSEVQHVRPQQGQVVVTPGLTQGQTNARQPQTVGLQTVTTATRPLTSQVTSGAVPQVGTQIVSQVPQVGSQVPWVGK